MWLIILSDQLSVFALVGRYPANKLMDRGPIFRCEVSEETPRFSLTLYQCVVLSGISPSFPGLFRAQR